MPSESAGSAEGRVRPTIETTMMEIAATVAKRSTCARRSVGCVLTDIENRVLAIGYNGVARGLPHCVDHPCEGASSASGEDLDKCEAIHAEQNALLQCFRIDLIDTAYCTTMPCVHCIKILLNTPCQRIVYQEDYPQSEQVLRLWEMAGRTVTRYAED